jgi:hypothetical protein
VAPSAPANRISGGTLTTGASFANGSIPGVVGIFRPSGVAVGSDGTIYAATDGRNGGTNAPALIAIDANGRVTTLDTT